MQIGLFLIAKESKFDTMKSKRQRIRYLSMIICWAVPFVGQAQEVIQSMFGATSRRIDFYDQKIITENVWKRVYYYENNQVEGVKENRILRFNSEEFFEIAIDEKQKQEILFSGTYLFDKNMLCLYDYTENFYQNDANLRKQLQCPRYKIINLIDNEYLIAEIYIPESKAGNYKTTNRLVLFQRQNMKWTDRVFNDRQALIMLSEKPQETAKYTVSSVQGIWKMLYHHGDLTQNELYKITSRNTMELKSDGVFLRTYPNDTSENDAGRYFINGQNMSLFSEVGREYVYRIVNIFDNEYLVTEMAVVKEGGQKSVQRFLYRRMN